MREFLTILCLFFVPLSQQQNQRVAPGVPPQHYQQPPHPTQQVQYQQHQVPVQQQVPMQNQQVPLQQPQHVPVHHEQVVMQQHQAPVQHHAHHSAQDSMHAGHPGGSQILNAANIAHEREHIAEHLSVPIDTSKMTEQELQFHYFKMHDADNNNKLDGCELIKSLIHWHEQGHKDPMNPTAAPQEKIFGDEELISLIDPIFNVDDANKDGFIDYPEFIQAQNKAAAKPSH